VIDRRTLIGGAGGAMTLAAMPRLAAGAQLKAIGLQLYTVREIFQEDPVGTLEAVARIGYREVEYGGGGYDTMDHRLLRRTMDRLKLKAPSVHIGYDALLADLPKQVTMAKTLGADTVVLPYMTEQYRNEAAWRAALPNIVRFATELKRAGLGFAYHNHDFEFTVKVGDKSLYDLLLDATDPALVKIELDLYWAIVAGQDIGALLDRLSPRLYAYHVKDRRPDGKMTAVGTGTVDFGAIFARPSGRGVRHFYVENDQAPAPYLPDITTSFKTLRALRF
jgi:sugar phosphate isomerase/epimerase